MNYCINRKIKERKKRKPRTKTPTNEPERDALAPKAENSNPTVPNSKPKSRFLDNWDELDEPAPAKPQARRKSEEDFFRILNEPSSSSASTPASAPSSEKTEGKTETKNEVKTEKGDDGENVASPDGWDSGNEVSFLFSSTLPLFFIYIFILHFFIFVYFI